MSDYSFMKTGLIASETHQDNEKQMLRKVVSLLKILMTQSMKTAEKFVTACGRNIIAAQDIKLALKYEAHEFIHRDFDDEFFENLREEETHTYETESEGEEGEEEGDEGEEGEEGEGGQSLLKNMGTVTEEHEDYSLECTATDVALVEFHRKVLEYDANWDSWDPNDAYMQLLKNCIDRTP